VGAHENGRRQAGHRAPDACSDADGRRHVLRRRPRGHPVPPRRLPPRAFEHSDGDRALQRVAVSCGAVRASVRPSSRGGPSPACAVLPPPARLRGCARGSRPGARAL
jgi:hypothetical protein